MTMDKQSIRKLMRARRKAVTPEERAAASDAICARLLARADVQSALARNAVIAVYMALPDEIDLSPFTSAALARGGRIAAPRWNGAGYELALLRSLDELVVGPHEVPEPPPSESVEEPAIWLVPGLAFTADGRRIGYGGGWYDRLLRASSAHAAKLGVAYDFQLLDDLPAEPHDIPLTGVITNHPVC